MFSFINLDSLSVVTGGKLVGPTEPKFGSGRPDPFDPSPTRPGGPQLPPGSPGPTFPVPPRPPIA